MLTDEIESTDQQMRALAREILTLEQKYALLLKRSGENRPWVWMKYGDRVLAYERQDQEARVHQERELSQVNFLVEHFRAQGLNPEEHIVGWEWSNGTPVRRKA